MGISHPNYVLPSFLIQFLCGEKIKHSKLKYTSLSVSLYETGPESVPYVL